IIRIDDPKAADTELPELPPLPIGALVVGALNLLDEAIGLPQPQDIHVSDLQHVSLQFAGEQPSIGALTLWALRFGGVLASELHDPARGAQPGCRLESDYYGVAVKAYPHAPAAPATI